MTRMDRRDGRSSSLRWRITRGMSWLDLVEERAASEKRLFGGRLNGLEVVRGEDAALASRELIRRALL